MKVLQFLKQNPKTAGVILLLVVLVSLGAYIGIKSRPSNTVGIPQEAVDAHNRAEQEKGAADELRRQRTELERENDELRKKNIELEQELESAKQKTEDARKAYEQSRNTRPRITPVDGNTSTDSLCTRASKLGIKCQ